MRRPRPRPSEHHAELDPPFCFSSAQAKATGWRACQLLLLEQRRSRMADQVRRGVLKGAAAVGAFAAVRSAAAQGRSDDGPPRELDGKAMPEPPAERSAGPIRAARGSMLQDKVAVVTGAARGIGRAIAVEMAA